MASSTFLFVGFSLSDPYFVQELELVNEMFAGASRTHYAIIREDDADAFLARLKSLPVIPLAVPDYGAPVIDLLEQLSDVADNLTGLRFTLRSHQEGATLTVYFSGSLDVNSVPDALEWLPRLLSPAVSV